MKRSMRYYDLKKNWPKVRRHLNDKELNDILVRDFNRFTYGRWRKKFTYGQFPRDFESCDWDWEIPGRRPAFWRYTKHAACHWIANFTLRLAMLVEPKQPWRIITSEKHTTVWNGKGVIFDFNFQAFGISATHCFESAYEDECPPGAYRRCYLAQHWRHEMAQSKGRKK